MTTHDGNGGVSPNTNKKEVVVGSSSEIKYYQVVRQTLPSLDAIRLSCTVSGLTISTAMLAAAFSADHFIEMLSSGLVYDLAGSFIAMILCCISALSAWQFKRKVKMFGHFISCAVEIAKELETEFISADYNRLCLTHRFDEYTTAGSRGDNLFKYALSCIILIAFVSALFYITRFAMAVEPMIDKCCSKDVGSCVINQLMSLFSFPTGLSIS